MALPPIQSRPIVVGEEPELGTLQALLDVLLRSQDALFAILDAARDPRILPLLRLSGEEHCCLYDGQSAEQLERVAPYLVRLPHDCRLLKLIVLHGWGEGWGVFVTSSASLQTVRARLRHFLMVEREGKPVYFRFYDPLVLRNFLPTCNIPEGREWFKELSGYLMEDEDPETLLSFSPKSAGVHLQRVCWMPSIGAAR